MPDMKITDFLRHDAQTYGVPGSPSIERILEVCVAAANWIDKLESRLAQAERERDAVVADWKRSRLKGEAMCCTCEFCEDGSQCLSPIPCEDGERWEWSGL